MHLRAVTEPHLGLLRVNVDVHLHRVDFKHEAIQGLHGTVQNVRVSGSHRVLQDFVPHKAAVYEKVLIGRAGFGRARQPGKPRDAHVKTFGGNRAAIDLKVLGHHGKDAFFLRLCWKNQGAFTVDRHPEFNLGA